VVIRSQESGTQPANSEKWVFGIRKVGEFHANQNAIYRYPKDILIGMKFAIGKHTLTVMRIFPNCLSGVFALILSVLFLEINERTTQTKSGKNKWWGRWSTTVVFQS